MHPYWVGDNYHNKLDCDLIQTFVFQLAGEPGVNFYSKPILKTADFATDYIDAGGSYSDIIKMTWMG